MTDKQRRRPNWTDLPGTVDPDPEPEENKDEKEPVSQEDRIAPNRPDTSDRSRDTSSETGSDTSFRTSPRRSRDTSSETGQEESSDDSHHVVYDPAFNDPDQDEGQVLGRGDTQAEATADARIRTGRNVGFDTDTEELARAQRRQLQKIRENIQRRRENLPGTNDANRINIEGTGFEDILETDARGTVTRRELERTLEEQEEELEQSLQGLEEFENNTRETDWTDLPGVLDETVDPIDIEPENIDREEFLITDSELDEINPSGTRTPQGISNEFDTADPEDILPMNIRTGLGLPLSPQGVRFGVGQATDRLGLTEDLREDALEEQRRMTEEGERIEAGDFLSSPVGLALSAVGGGAVLQSLRTAAPRAATATEATLAAGTGGLVGVEGMRAREEVQEGESEAAAERLGVLSAELGIVGAGIGAGGRRLQPRIGDTRVSDVDIRLEETPADTLAGRGTADTQTGIEIPRIFGRSDTRTLEGDADFIVQQTDQGSTIGGRLTQERLLDDPVQQDFFGTGRTRFDDGDQIITRDRLETEDDLFFGATRSTQTETDQVGRITEIEDGAIRTQEGEFEISEFDTFTQFDDQPGTILGTTRTTVDRTPSETGTGTGLTAGTGRTAGSGGGMAVSRATQRPDTIITEGQLQRVIDESFDLDAATLSPTDAATVSGGAAASGRTSQAMTDTELQEFEQELEQTETTQEVLVGSPTRPGTDFAREPVTDRLTFEGETDTQLQAFEQDLQTVEPEIPVQGARRSTFRRTDPDTVPVTRPSPETIEEPDFGLMQAPGQEQRTDTRMRPLEQGVLDVTRRELPEFRQIAPIQQRVGLTRRQPSIFPGLDTAQTRQTPATLRPFGGGPRGGIPSLGTGGFTEPGLDPVEPFGAEPDPGLTPDLTGQIFGEGIGIDEIEEDDFEFTGLEARTTTRRREDDLDPGLF